ncbi:hypothetical protein [Parendozoicomonas sp. Alg238-R29]|nr:hypothetical protein [Parendozoicomonas sp. Alg238-R29]
MKFYEFCPVNKDDVATDVKNSRLQLCALTARSLHLHTIPPYPYCWYC